MGTAALVASRKQIVPLEEYLVSYNRAMDNAFVRCCQLVNQPSISQQPFRHRPLRESFRSCQPALIPCFTASKLTSSHLDQLRRPDSIVTTARRELIFAKDSNRMHSTVSQLRTAQTLPFGLEKGRETNASESHMGMRQPLFG